MIIEGRLHRPTFAAPAAVAPADDPHAALADTVLAAHGVPQQDHVLMRENMATYFAQVMSKRKARGMAEDGSSADAVLSYVKASPAGGRWMKKIEREIAAPYTDAQVHGQLQALGSGLEAWIARIDKGYPMKMEITGSLTKGRAGANSDIDLLIEVKKKPGDDTEPPPVNDQQHEKANISLTELSRLGFGQRNFMRRMMGPRIEVPDRPDSQFVVRAYSDVLSRKGLRFVDQGAAGIHVERFAPAPKRRPEIPFKMMGKAIDLALDEDHDADEIDQMKRNDGIMRKALNVAMTVTGIAAAIPGPIGWITVKLLDKIVVRQTAP